MTIQATDTFCEQVMTVWGDPKAVAEAAMEELLRHVDEFCIDYDDQISYAVTIGILAGATMDDSFDEFVARFTDEVLNEE